MSYEDLCKRVEAIDPAAAEYMRGDAKGLEGFEFKSCMNECFVWSETPQGYNYWSGINSKLEEKEMNKLKQAVEQSGYSKAELSRRLGKSKNYISEMLRVGCSSKKQEELIKMIESGEVYKSDDQIIAELTLKLADAQDWNTIQSKENEDLIIKREILERQLKEFMDLSGTLNDENDGLATRITQQRKTISNKNTDIKNRNFVIFVLIVLEIVTVLAAIGVAI